MWKKIICHCEKIQYHYFKDDEVLENLEDDMIIDPEAEIIPPIDEVLMDENVEELEHE